MNNAAIHIGVQIYLRDTDINSFSYIPSGIAESYSTSILNFYWNKANSSFLCVVYESFCVTTVKLSSCEKHDIAHEHKIFTKYTLQCLPIPALIK